MIQSPDQIAESQFRSLDGGPREHPVKGVYRVDDSKKRMHGYYALLVVDRRPRRRLFSDRRYGSPAAAYAAAKDAMLACREEHEMYLAMRRRHRRRRNSPAEIPGVHRVPPRPLGPRDRWVARWHDATGKRRQSSYRVAMHGEVEAYELALKKRLAETVEERERLRVMSEHFAGFSFNDSPPAKARWGLLSAPEGKTSIS